MLTKRILTAAVIGLVIALACASTAGAKTKTKTFTTGPTSIPIPDAVSSPNSLVPGEAVSNIPVSNKGTIKNVSVSIQITHSDTGDIAIAVRHGTVYVPLSNRSQGTAPDDNNFGSGTGCTGGMTTFTGTATRHLSDSSNPYDGEFLPAFDFTPLRFFNGRQLKGNWALGVIDAVPGDVGTITCFQMTATYKKG